MNSACPVCESQQRQTRFCVRDGYNYFACSDCESLYIDPMVLSKFDEGHTTREYDEQYWNNEVQSARDRSRTEGLVCSGEVIIYARRPVERFLDIGAGPGYLLDELAAKYPAHQNMFHAVELFPPEERSTHPNYVVGDVSTFVMTQRFLHRSGR